jgi:hypothetical protein
MTCRIGVPHQDLDPGIPVCQWSSTQDRVSWLARRRPNACHWFQPTAPRGRDPCKYGHHHHERLHFLLGHSWWLATSLVRDLPLSFALPHTPELNRPANLDIHISSRISIYLFLNSSFRYTGVWRTIEGLHSPALPNEANNILEIDE